MTDIFNHEMQGQIWDFYKPRHTHSWNMLVLSWRALDELETDNSFENEYRWENFILRLWLYRTTVRTLTKLKVVRADAGEALKAFDSVFTIQSKNDLKALRDMIEHFDDYAVGIGRGPATRDQELDPWRTITKDHYERGRFLLDRKKSYDAAITLRDDAKTVSNKFITWYKSKISQ